MISGYKIVEEIYRGRNRVVYRGHRESDGAPVAIKTLIGDFPSQKDIDGLRREYEILDGIKIAGVIKAYGLEKYDNRPALVLEDIGGETLRSLIGSKGIDFITFLNIGIKLSQTVGELHQNNVIHKDINPTNIIVNLRTGRTQLIDFSVSSFLPFENPKINHPGLLEGTLAYMSPEQTGRMNRAVDYRADFYSLGVTFYEALTARLPFHSTDPLELVHSHIAKIPPQPCELNPDIPKAVSDIVMKLMAKTAEDRYKSAYGLKADLERCLAELRRNGNIPDFSPGEDDFSDRFQIPQKLYGREDEIATLMSAFDRVSDGATEMMLVSGYSGIGKTSLIQELYKPIARERGYFISGKFDQVVRSIPFGALIQAFHGLVRQLLTESEESLARWRSILSAALGINGGVLAEVIPEIELIIGKQEPPTELGPTESLNRFQLVFQNFVGALARREHPLAVFLDDLQWADSATLSLFQPLLTSQDIRCFFLMGAYRDNEVDAAHPLTRTLGALEAAGVRLNRAVLGPLQLPDLTLLIRDTLHGEGVEPLARLVFEKTGGNPFFLTQFLKTLNQEGFIGFDYAQKRWTCRLNAVIAAPFTDNVIDLMTQKIERLSPPARRALTLAACIGNSFDLSTLAVVSEQGAREAADDLRQAVDEGLVLNLARDYEASDQPESSAPAYIFLHDRVQQAAYALIPEGRKQFLHLTIGRLLQSGVGFGESDQKLFDIVHHLNRGGVLITEESERLALARLNLSAALKAKSSTAHEAALNYLKAGMGLLDRKAWESDYDLAFALNFEAAECQYLCGNFDAAEQSFESLLQHAGNKLDKSRVYRLRSVQLENTARYADALAVARENLALFGVSFPDSAEEKEAALEKEIESVRRLLGEREIESLVELPVMTDHETQMVMNILTDIWSPAYIVGDAILARLISATMVRLSLVHGNVEESAYGYVTHAITVGPVREDYKSAYEFGMLALKVNERFNDSRRRAKIHQQFHAHVNFWRQPMRTCVPYAQEACRSGLESGDFLYAAYGASTESWPAIVSSQDLAQFVRHFTPNLALIKKLKITSFADSLRMIMNWALALQGKTESPLSLSDEGFDENEYVETYRDNPFFTMFHAILKLHLFYAFGEYSKALETARAVRGIVHQLTGMVWSVMFDFWNALTLAANYADANARERRTYLAEMEKTQKSFAVLADNCPENFLCQSLLLSAEIERVTVRQHDALELYERAIGYAEETRMVQHRALANELCANFWLERGQEKVAAVFMTEARAYYAQWGATAKVRALEEKYPRLFTQSRLERETWVSDFQTTLSTIRAGSETLDLMTVIKSSQVISGEIVFRQLIEKLMRIVIENAGAEKGVLLLEKEGVLIAQAESRSEKEEITVLQSIHVGAVRKSPLPQTILNYVKRTCESVVLADAVNDPQFAKDTYVVEKRPKSILCVPILLQGKFIGILYLENSLTIGAFTPERTEVAQILSSQAAISLENARLYDEMKGEIAERERMENTLRAIMEGTASVTGRDFFRSLVRHLARAFHVRYGFVAECTDDLKTRVGTLAFWSGEGFGENFSYALSGTPCRNVIDGEVCYYPERVQSLFPEDEDLVSISAESYFGIPLYGSSGDILGHLAVIDDKPMNIGGHENISILKIFAARAGAELERKRAGDALQMALRQVEELKNRLQVENIYLQEEIKTEYNFEEIIGQSESLKKALRKVEQVAPTGSTVLIHGETGTGKELIARAIHNLSPRKDRPLVKVNCGAISAGLVESELFGHERGAFTGAVQRRIGRFELADGGTIFLDEVTELPLDTQVKLLRVLQEGEFERVGSSKSINVDVRVIAATNRDVGEAVKAAKFRSDLFYRLNVFPLEAPPLRERKSDIPLLANFFLTKFSKKLGKRFQNISSNTMDALTSYGWPGNIRELQNVMERAVVLSQGSAIQIDESTLGLNGGSEASVKETLEDVERAHIIRVLEQTDWVIQGNGGAASVLGLNPNTLRSRMQKLGIRKPKS